MKINYHEFVCNEEFYSLPLYVDNRVLIPRNDTEIIIDAVRKEMNWLTDFVFIDVWTWSWAIPIALLQYIQFIQVYALDISPEALQVADINIHIHNLEEKIHLVHSDLLSYFLSNQQQIPSQKIIFTANLPYIKNNDFENMDIDVIQNEPHIALFWWPDTWFELYERLIDQIYLFKKMYHISECILFIEIWFDQSDYSRQYFQNNGLSVVYYKDFNGINRIVKVII